MHSENEKALNEITLIEAIRKRPAMYIGSTSIRGFNNLLRELINDIFDTTEANYLDRKSTRLNSSHANISYAVFCLKKKRCCLVFLIFCFIRFPSLSSHYFSICVHPRSSSLILFL